MTVVKLEMKSVILQGSLPIDETYEIEDSNEILSKEFIIKNRNTWDENW